ncbi:MAG: helicase, partial [Cohnella sp.]|nr:helicase [Cohnella sp.]
MSLELTERVIKRLCGRFSYERGEPYYRDGQVTFTHCDHENFTYGSTVAGKRNYEVTVDLDPAGDVRAECTCPAFNSYDQYCEHIAASLLHIHDYQQGAELPVVAGASGLPLDHSDDYVLADGLLGLFGDKLPRSGSPHTLFDQRTKLEVAFTCRSIPFGYKQYMFAIEMKAGPGKLYVVQNMSQFLERIDRG